MKQSLRNRYSMKNFSKILGAALLASAVALSGNAATTPTIIEDLLVKTVSAPQKNPQTLATIKDPCGQIEVDSNVAFHPYRKMLINTIDPVKLAVLTNGTQSTKLVEDDAGATCFSGNVAVMPCESMKVGTQVQVMRRKLLVNEINPVKFDFLLDENGDKVRDACAKVATGLGQFVRTCVPDDKGVTCFSGNAAMHPNKKFLVNEINPVKLSKGTGCDAGIYVEDDTDQAVTKFSGNVYVGNGRDLTVSGSVILHAAILNDNVTIAVGKKLLTNEIDPTSGDDTHFSGNVVLDAGKSLTLTGSIRDTSIYNAPPLLANAPISLGIDSTGVIGTFAVGAGGGTSANKPFTLVLRDGSGDFAAGTITAETDLVVIGNQSIGGTLLVNEIDPIAGDTTHFSGSLHVGNGQDLTVSGSSTLRGDVLIPTSNLTVGGTTALNDNVTVATDKTLFVNEIDPTSGGSTHFSGNVHVGNGQDLTVSGSSTLHGDVSFGGALSFNNNVTIATGSTLFTNEIDPTSGGSTHFSGNVHVGNCQDLTVSGSSTLRGDTTVVEGRTLFTNEIDPTSGGSTHFSGNVHVGNCKDLTVSGSSTLRGGVFTNEIDPLVSGGSTHFSGNVHVGNCKDLTVSGSSTLRGGVFTNEIDPLVSGGSTHFSGNLHVGNGKDLTVSGSSTLRGNTTIIAGKTLFTNEIDPVVSGGSTHFSGNLHVGNSKDLTVSGSSTLRGGVFTNEIDPLVSGGSTHFSGNLHVGNGKDLTVSGSSTLRGNTTIIAGKTLFTNEIDPVVSGGSTHFSGSLHVGNGKDLTVSGSSTLRGNTTIIAGKTLFTDEIDPTTSGGSTHFSGNLHVGNGKDLTVSGSSTLRGNTTIVAGKTLFTNEIDPTSGNSTHFSGHLHVGNGRDLTVSGSSTLRGNTTIIAGKTLFTNDIDPISPAVTTQFSGSINLPDTTSANAGSLQIGGARFLHNFGSGNTFVGSTAGNTSMTGGANTALGQGGLSKTTTGVSNTAVGHNSLFSLTTANENTAIGRYSLQSIDTAGNANTAIGYASLNNLASGYRNIAIGWEAGADLTLADHSNIDIGDFGTSGDVGVIRIGTALEQTKCFIAGIRGVTTGAADAVAVLIDSSGQLGTVSSSRRYKKDIKDMAFTERLAKLRPVNFVYKTDESETIQYGLIAEEVAEVFPELVIFNPDGEPETVRYHDLAVMLLNEYQKQQKQLDLQSMSTAELLDRLAVVEALLAQKQDPSLTDLLTRLAQVEALLAQK